MTKSELYEQLEPKINAGEVELLDEPVMIDQLLGLVMRGTKIDHQSGEHDDRVNSAAGSLMAVRTGQPVDLATQAFVNDPTEDRALRDERLAELGYAADGTDESGSPFDTWREIS